MINNMFSNSKQTNMYGGVPPPYPPSPGMYIPSDIKGLLAGLIRKKPTENFSDYNVPYNYLIHTRI
jgi:hypothetical protein